MGLFFKGFPQLQCHGYLYQGIHGRCDQPTLNRGAHLHHAFPTAVTPATRQQRGKSVQHKSFHPADLHDQLPCNRKLESLKPLQQSGAVRNQGMKELWEIGTTTHPGKFYLKICNSGVCLWDIQPTPYFQKLLTKMRILFLLQPTHRFKTFHYPFFSNKNNKNLLILGEIYQLQVVWFPKPQYFTSVGKPTTIKVFLHPAVAGGGRLSGD